MSCTVTVVRHFPSSQNSIAKFSPVGVIPGQGRCYNGRNTSQIQSMKVSWIELGISLKLPRTSGKNLDFLTVEKTRTWNGEGKLESWCNQHHEETEVVGYKRIEEYFPAEGPLVICQIKKQFYTARSKHHGSVC